MPTPETRGLSGHPAMAAGLLVAALCAAALAWGVEHVPGAALTPFRWLCEPAALAALLLLLAAVAVLVDGLGKATARAPLWLRIGGLVLAVALYASFALLATWTAFGPGPPSFASFAALLPAGNAGELAGRCVIGIGALIAWTLTLLLAAAGVFRLVAPPRASGPED